MTAAGSIRYWPPQKPKRPRGVWLVDGRPHVIMRVKRLFSRVEPNSKGGVFITDTDDVALDLEWLTARYEFEIDDDALAHMRQRAQARRERGELMQRILGGGELEVSGGLVPSRAVERREYQYIAADLAIATGRLLIIDDLGLGKAQPLDAPVLTPRGFMPMGTIKVGDEVTAADGTVTRVSGVYPQGEIDCYAVTFSDGAVVECSADHLWQVRHCHGPTRSKRTGERNPRHWRTATLAALARAGLRTSTGQAKWHVPVVTAPYLDCGWSRPLDPYLLGALLGDGGMTGTHRSVRLTTADDELVDVVQDVVPPDVCVEPVRGTRYDYTLVHRPAPGTATGAGRRHPVIRALNDLGVWGKSSLDKFVPYAYLIAPPEVRLAVLQGLMDTDGYAMPLPGGNASAFFYSSSRQLAFDVRWLTESLGGIARLTSKFADERDRYTVAVKLPQPLNPFRLSRKARVWGDGHRTLRPTRAIKSVEYVGRKPMQCIAVEHPSRLYVTDRFVVTHNTITAGLVLRAPDALPAVVVTLTHLPRQWEREMRFLYPGIRVHVATRGSAYDLSGRCEGRPPHVLILNYAKLAGWADYLYGEARTVVFDEMQELRRSKGSTPDAVYSYKYAGAAKLAEGARYRVGLTATPVYNYGGEMHNIVSILDPDALGSREEFVREWGAGNSSQMEKVTIEDPDGLRAFLEDEGIILVRTRADVGRELPGDVMQVQHVVDTDSAALDAVAGDASAMARLVLDNTAKQSERFVAAGDLDWRLRQATGLAKAPYVAEFVRMMLETEKRVVLFGWHRAVYDIWLDRLAEFSPAMYTGSESPNQKAAAADAFLNGDARVLIMSLRSGAGLDGLQEVCNVAVFGELDWSPMVHRQCVGRLYRDGQTQPVLAYFLVADEGSDPVVAEVLQIKRGQAEPMFGKVGKVIEVPDPRERARLLAEAVLARKSRKR